MIELRWVTKQTPCKIPPVQGAIGSAWIDGLESKDVLQYRILTNAYNAETGRYERWSEWKDVPHHGLETPVND